MNAAIHPWAVIGYEGLYNIKGRNMQCVKCNTNNRSSAKFCKQCGTAISNAETTASLGTSLGLSIDQLVGFDEIKKELS